MRRWLSATLIAATAACAGGGAPMLTTTPDAGTPLEARVLPPYYGQVAMHLSKPAYVALFEVVPGAGASLLYPRAGTGFQQVSQSWVPLRFVPDRWLYASDPRGMGYGRASHVNRMYAGLDPWQAHSARGAGAPRYFFLVASEEPLFVEQFQHDAAALRQYLGAARFASGDPYDVMERLAYAILPFADKDSWVTDVLVDWGYDWWGYGAGPAASASMMSMVPVQCANGLVTLAPYASGFGWLQPPCGGLGFTLPRQPVFPGPVVPGPGGEVPPPASGEGRSRSGAAADSGGRSRAAAAAIATGTADEQRGAAVSPELRSRYVALRADAQRDGFREEFSERLRDQVRTRQIADVYRGYRAPEPAVRAAGRDGASAAAAGGSANTPRRRGVDAAPAAQDAGRTTTPSSDALRRRAAERTAERTAERGAAARGDARVSSPSPRSRAGAASSGSAPASSGSAPAGSRSGGSSAGSAPSGSTSTPATGSGSTGGRSRTPPR